MGVFDGFREDENRELENTTESETAEQGTLHLRKEELDIAKDRVPAGEVRLRKEVVEENKVVEVPVAHEEVFIEQRAVNEPSDSPIMGNEEIIRIPVTEEQVEVGKHTVVTGEVSAYKREVENTRQIEETLKKEEARIEREGDVDIISGETDHQLH
ncbi:YsnF/AvaK domain-containing protein [Heliobacterium chlorum]|uniref:YsnF/AvaK domain-containing protein n=2 Tax=Heliobacterium chlorum TaxID=2698 RepID=A0ABR7T4M2_HELCL|nr:YsnF/AvaK domain-containing protein [Heliobacterium chlorum]MBC9784616.1 YsnF/AvaK domain-containing protein [Heliobacterium chlorum]